MTPTTPLAIPTRTLSDTPSTHRDDHNAFSNAINEITGSATFIAPTGVAADDTANMQSALDQGPNVRIICGPGEFKINAPLRYDSFTEIQGAGWSDQGDRSGTTFTWSGSTLGKARGMLEARNYFANSTNEDVGCRFHGFMMNGALSTTGNGLIGYGGRLHVEHVAFYNWAGTAAGSGRGIFCASNSYTFQNTGSGGVVVSGAENCMIRDCRFQCLREGVYVDSGTQQWTDGYLHDSEWLTTTNLSGTMGAGGINVPQVQIRQGGGWNLRALHSNGSPGDFISLDNCMECVVTDCYVDGWGCAPAAGAEYAGIHVAGMSNGDGGRNIIITHNMFRSRTQQSGATGTDWPAIWVEPGTGYDATAIIAHNNGHIRAGAAASRCYFMHLNSASGLITYVINGNAPLHDNTGAIGNAGSIPYDDSTIYHTPNNSTGVKVASEGNSWQQDDAAPTAGFWPRGAKRYNSGAGAGGVFGWMNVANGSPGTWRSMGNLA